MPFRLRKIDGTLSLQHLDEDGEPYSTTYLIDGEDEELLALLGSHFKEKNKMYSKPSALRGFLFQGGVVLGLVTFICSLTWLYNNGVESVNKANAEEKVFTVISVEPGFRSSDRSEALWVEYTYDGGKTYAGKLYRKDWWMPKPGDKAKKQSSNGYNYVVPPDGDED